jgi:hypothetical protein
VPTTARAIFHPPFSISSLLTKRSLLTTTMSSNATTRVVSDKDESGFPFFFPSDGEEIEKVWE